MTRPIALSLQRLLVSLFCIQALASAAAAQAPAARQVIARMPNGPNFQAPSAADCARPVPMVQISQMANVNPAAPIDSLRGLDPAFGTRTLTLTDGRRVGSASSRAETGAEEDEMADVIITGSKIQVGARANFDTAMTTITAQDMMDRGITNIGDSLLEMVPQNLSTYRPGLIGDAGSAGDRRVGSTSSQADVVDLNSINSSMVSRMDVVTGGNSAVYGSGAIGGPANRVQIEQQSRQRALQLQQAAAPTVTAGMVDDNADFSEYLNFRRRTQVPHWEIDISERYLLQVRDARGAVVPDAEVTVQGPNGAAMWARTDAGGRVWLHPRAFDANSQMYEVSVRKNGRLGTSFLQRGQKSAVDVVIGNPGARPARAQLDLVFLIDATGSMGDEIAKLKTTLHTIANEVAALPSHPDTCFGLVAYRDTGDEFVVRRKDFTNNLGGFQAVLNALEAGGGGDYPEAMNQALAETVHRLNWRGNDTTRLVMLLADAPPHLNYNEPRYDDSMIAALGKGIKVLSVGASGLDKQGEYIQRQIAQYTGGRFVFLTYRDAANPASGPGRQTVHDVNDYSVQTLDRLIVRLVSEELEKLPRGR